MVYRGTGSLTQYEGACVGVEVGEANQKADSNEELDRRGEGQGHPEQQSCCCKTGQYWFTAISMNRKY